MQQNQEELIFNNFSYKNKIIWNALCKRIVNHIGWIVVKQYFQFGSYTGPDLYNFSHSQTSSISTFLQTPTVSSTDENLRKY